MIQPIIDESTIARLRELLLGARRVVLTCHLSPDGDAIGATAALCRVLRRLGKDARVITPDMPPKALAFLTEIQDVVIFSKTEVHARHLLEKADLFFCLDFNSLYRIDRLADPLTANPAPKILIDHHLNPQDGLFALQLSFPEMSSTCELVFRMLLQLRMVNLIDRDTASCLYTGIITDTGNLTHGNITSELFEILAVLTRRGINNQRLYKLAMNTFSEGSVRLQGHALSHCMRLFADRGVALTVLSRDDLEQYHYRKGDTEGLVNKPLAIPGISMSIFLREDPENIKVSCRSEGDIDVSVICSDHFGGGGHLNAAGGEYHGPLADAVAFTEHVIEHLPLLNKEKTTN